MQVKELRRILEILEENGLGSDYIEADHEILYFPDISRINEPDLEGLMDSGIFYSHDYDSWLCYV